MERKEIETYLKNEYKIRQIDENLYRPLDNSYIFIIKLVGSNSYIFSPAVALETNYLAIIYMNDICELNLFGGKIVFSIIEWLGMQPDKEFRTEQNDEEK